MIFFYTKNIAGQEAILEDEEYVHCCKVLRRQVGDIIHITDGKGQSGIATISSISKKSAVLIIKDIVNHDISPYKFTIAIAPPKNRARWEWFIEKSVEIGITHIIPLKTKNSERIKINIDRSKKIIRSAAIQSLRYHHPLISDTMSIDTLLREGHTYDNKLIAHYQPEHPFLVSKNSTGKSNIILIGPEGDFSPEELISAKKHDFRAVNISNNRLRTETAGIVAITQMMSLKSIL